MYREGLDNCVFDRFIFSAPVFVHGTLPQRPRLNSQSLHVNVWVTGDCFNWVAAWGKLVWGGYLLGFQKVQAMFEFEILDLFWIFLKEIWKSFLLKISRVSTLINDKLNPPCTPRQLIPHQSVPGTGHQVKKVRVCCPGRVRTFFPASHPAPIWQMQIN